MATIPQGRGIDRSSYEPAYVQLVNILRGAIASGQYQAGDQLPTESELCAAYDVSPMTVRRAIGMLLDQGAVSTTRGRGTFVQPLRLATATFDLSEFHDILAEPGVTARVVEARVLPAGPRAAANLGVPDGTHVVSIRRILQRGDEPLIYHRESLIYDPTRPTVESELDVTALRDMFEGGAGSRAQARRAHPPRLGAHRGGGRPAAPAGRGGRLGARAHLLQLRREADQLGLLHLQRRPVLVPRERWRAGARRRGRREKETPMTEFDSLDPASLAGRIAALDEQGALDAVHARIKAGDDPLAIIEECQLGMRWVGEHYQSGKYFISGLIMAGEIFREAMVALGPLLPPETEDAAQGSVLIATVRGDIHDLGKNIVIMMLRSYGIVVHDLGVDVSPDEVVRQDGRAAARHRGAQRPAHRRHRGHEDHRRGGARGREAHRPPRAGHHRRRHRRRADGHAGPAPTCGPTTPRAACGSSARRSPRRAAEAAAGAPLPGVA